MKLNVHEIEESAKALAYEEPTDALNALLVHGDVCDFEFAEPAAVRIEYYRAGLELFFDGHVASRVIGHCGRCLENFAFPLDADFSLVLVPRPPVSHGDGELSADELDVGFYDGDLVDLTPVVREQIIVALPTRPLCSEECKGLCPTCGANRNTQTCDCATTTGDARLAALRNLKVGH